MIRAFLGARVVGVLVGIATLGPPLAAYAHDVVFSLSIGYNGLPASAEKDLTPLRFADDDAASFHQFAAAFTRRSILLTILDRETQERFPGLAAEARSPSRAELTKAVAELQVALQAAAAQGEEPTLLIFYSGHGTRDAEGQSALTLLDGELTHEMLYEQLLIPLRARFVHLFVDACHAEAVVRPRDAKAEIVDPAPAEIEDYLRQSTLARFPNVGAVVASTAGGQAHEWDAYQSGIFTHEILSALRGAADIDGNQRIEYSELAAFLASANREVSDSRARPQTIIRPPPLNPRVPIVDLRELRGTAFLEGQPAALGAFFVEGPRGNRLVDLRAEPGFPVVLALPSQEVLFLRNAQGEVALRLATGQRLRFEDLHLAKSDLRARGALDTSLRRGLFAARFGPDYYRGFVDRQGDLPSVELPIIDAALARSTPLRAEPTIGVRGAAVAAIASSAALLLGAAVFGEMAWSARQDFQNTVLERTANDARDRYQLDLTLSLGSLVSGALTAVLGAYLSQRDPPP